MDQAVDVLFNAVRQDWSLCVPVSVFVLHIEPSLPCCIVRSLNVKALHKTCRPQLYLLYARESIYVSAIDGRVADGVNGDCW